VSFFGGPAFVVPARPRGPARWRSVTDLSARDIGPTALRHAPIPSYRVVAILLDANGRFRLNNDPNQAI
jgi:hypothetical protein